MPSTSTKFISIENLHLDILNPRLGRKFKNISESVSEQDVLDSIVKQHGVDDLLGSISINGYFEAEPLVGIEEEPNKIVIVEGNRRLTACLILTGDPRASNQTKRTTHFQRISTPDILTSLKTLPVSIHKSRDSLLSYLGIRHISGAKGWDSYAKASWLYDVIIDSPSQFTIRQASDMIGDKQNTIKKILEGYILVKQLEDASMFVPTDSIRSGKGSNTDYPFSWVYTAIGYSNIKEWLNTNDLKADAVYNNTTKLIDDENLEKASKLLQFLFGSKSKSFNPSINDSRQIRDIAEVIQNKEQFRALEKGVPIEEVVAKGKPAGDRVSNLMIDVKDNLETVVGLISQSEESEIDFFELITVSKKSQRLLNNIIFTSENSTSIDGKPE